MIQKKEKKPEETKTGKLHNTEHDKEQPEQSVTEEETMDLIPDDDPFETAPPYEEPAPGEGP